MREPKNISLMHKLINAIGIVVSILIAFALEAGWDSLQERQRGEAILTDLAREIRVNIADLDITNGRHVIRLERLNQIIREAGSDRLGLDAQTLNTLLAELVSTPTLDMRNGVLYQLLQAGNLSLLENPELRNRLSGLQGFMADYLLNQTSQGYILINPATFLSTGSILFQHDTLSLPLPDAVLGASVPWADPPTPEQVQALKLLAIIKGLTEITILRAPAVRKELTEILTLIEADESEVVTTVVMEG